MEVVYALPDRHWSVTVELPAGATVAQALAAAELPGRVPGLDVGALGLGIFGRRAELDTPLREGDRIELLRPLRADPKTARRKRAARTGA